MMNIENHGPAISESDVAALEARLGASLPEQYRMFLLRFNGGSPPPGVVDVLGLEGGAADVQVLFGIRRSVRSSCLDWNIETLAGRMKEGRLPIACDSGGSVFCISLHGGDRGAVSYCDLQSVFGDLDAAPPLYPVASTFDSFLAGLRPFS